MLCLLPCLCSFNIPFFPLYYFSTVLHIAFACLWVFSVFLLVSSAWSSRGSHLLLPRHHFHCHRGMTAPHLLGGAEGQKVFPSLCLAGFLAVWLQVSNTSKGLIFMNFCSCFWKGWFARQESGLFSSLDWDCVLPKERLGLSAAQMFNYLQGKSHSRSQDDLFPPAVVGVCGPSSLPLGFQKTSSFYIV